MPWSLLSKLRVSCAPVGDFFEEVRDQMEAKEFPTPVKPIVHTPLTSSWLKSAGWDRESKLLEIEFLSGPCFRYADVPEATFLLLTNCASPGQCFAACIKNIYACQRVEK